MFNFDEINKNLESIKNNVGNQLFDQVTGQIKGTLETQGVKISAPVIPEAKQETEVDTKTNWRPVLMLLAVVGGGFFVIKSLKKSRA